MARSVVFNLDSLAISAILAILRVSAVRFCFSGSGDDVTRAITAFALKESRREQISPASGVLAYFEAGAGFEAAEAAGSGAGPNEATCASSST